MFRRPRHRPPTSTRTACTAGCRRCPPSTGAARQVSGRPARTERKGEGMADVVFVLLTIAVFAVLGLILKAVEKL
jgi:hypothetical protein